METSVVFCDGASNPHTKRSGIGVVWFKESQLKDPNDPKTLNIYEKPYKIVSEEIFSENSSYPTNNEAEYKSLIRALEVSLENNIDNIDIYMDSKLVVNQVNDKWKINFEHLQKLKNKVDTLKPSIHFTVTHVRREFNKHADKASKDCLKKPVISYFDKWAA